MRRFANSRAWASLVALLATLATSAPALLHNRLTKSAPAKDEILHGPPTAVRLWFLEPTEPALSSITLLAPDSTRVPLSKVRKTEDPRSITADVQGTPDPGVYTVQWRASGRDGHVIRGTYRFTIDP